jgi:alpha-glucosidase
MKLTALLCALLFGAVFARAEDTPVSVKSPDGNVVVTFSLSPAGEPRYRVDYLGKPVVTDSRLGFEPDMLGDFSLTLTKRGGHRGSWTNTLGERRDVPDNYNEVAVRLSRKDGRLLDVTFRAYDEGAALRYTIPNQPTSEFTFSGERTEFRFPAGTYGYEEHATEGEYRRALIAEFEPWVERPVTVELPDGRWAALAEAANLAYPRMLLSPLSGVPGALVSALGGTTANTVSREFAQKHDPTAKLRAGESTPWRMFVVGTRAGDLLERNYLMLNLNEPSALADISWIKPGKAMRDTLLTTANSKAIIDLAATAGLSFVHLDWKWYGGVEYEAAGDTTVRAPNLDIPEIVRYGREKGVGLILYIDRRQAMQRRDKIFKQMEDWGVVGVKIGFVDVGPQAATAWITETIQKAAEHHLMLNIHDGYRGTGLNRTGRTS